MEPDGIDDLLEEQLRYYRARAAEYDDWWLRRGRFDRGPEANARWHAEVLAAQRALDDFAPRGDVLELAAGTGLWSVRLVPHARRLTVVDASPEVLAINRARCEAECRRLGVPYEAVLADVFALPPRAPADTIVACFWLSHVPAPRWAAFWDLVRRSLAPGGRAFFVDSLRAVESTARDRALPEEGTEVATRTLGDGRTFRVVKRFHDPEGLARGLEAMGFSAAWGTTGSFFWWLSVTRREDAAITKPGSPRPQGRG